MNDRLYVQPDELKSAQEITSSFAEHEIPLCCEAASRVIDAYCSRRFWMDEEPTTRVYTAWRQDWTCHPQVSSVWIDDLVTLSSLNTSSEPGDDWPVLWEEGWYTLAPTNAASDGFPYMRIDAPWGAVPTLPRYGNGVSVTGLWGWPAVPAQVRLSASILAGRYLRRTREAPFGVLGYAGDDGGAVMLRKFDPDVAQLLDPLTRSEV